MAVAIERNSMAGAVFTVERKPIVPRTIKVVDPGGEIGSPPPSNILPDQVLSAVDMFIKRVGDPLKRAAIAKIPRR